MKLSNTFTAGMQHMKLNFSSEEQIEKYPRILPFWCLIAEAILQQLKTPDWLWYVDGLENLI